MISMKKFIFAFLVPAIMIFATACSSKAAINANLLPENITNVELRYFYGGGAEGPRTLDNTETEELREWVSNLSLKHRTFKAEEAPSDLNGGKVYTFVVDDSELFAWFGGGKNAYIRYENEWYEIRNTSKPPLGLP